MAKVHRKNKKGVTPRNTASRITTSRNTASRNTTSSKISRSSIICRIQEGAFILMMAASIFLFVALLSHHKTDPAWLSHGANGLTQNLAGKSGAFFSEIFLYLFGYVAYMFPMIIGYAGIRVIQKRFFFEPAHPTLWILRFIGFFSSVIAASSIMNLHFSDFSHGLTMGTGGLLGNKVAIYWVKAAGFHGATLTLLAIFLAGITLATGLSWFGLVDIVCRSSVISKGKRLLPMYLGLGVRAVKTFLMALFSRLISRPKFTLEKVNSLEKINALENINALEKTSRTPLLLEKVLDDDVKDDLKDNFKDDVKVFVAKMPINIPPKIKPIVNKPNINTLKKVFAELPSIELLEAPSAALQAEGYSHAKLQSLSREVEARLLEFGVQVVVVGVYPGPVITRFELELAAGLKVSKITGLSKDLARSLSVTRVRVVEVIPGKSVVGLEIPNEHRALVRFREIIESPIYNESQSPLTLALGKDISGLPVAVNLAKMPHLLVAGTTGSGKSVGINAMLLSLLYKATPEEVRLILIDPKMLELSIYDGIPHLLTPVVTDMKDAANALKWCVAEMERRYQLMASVGVRHLPGFNRKVEEAEEDKNPLYNPLWQPEMGGERPLLKRLPYVVVIIDEFADMMMVVGKKVEELIARIAQKARAAGIHLILATQRPSVDVITGLIKANIPTRIAFQVSSRIDSRTILDQQGAEQLLGHGDMLYLPPGSGIPARIHGAFVSDEEVHAVVKALKQFGEPDFAEDILSGGHLQSSSFAGGMEEGEDGEQDDLYDEAVRIVIESRRASISGLQRRLKIGYNRAARLIETMEAAGLVSAMQSNGNREVLVQNTEN